jgi:hypothetical protein
LAKAAKLDDLLKVKLENGKTVEEELRGVRWLARLLDSQFSIFGVRFGLDAIIGLVPVGGDIITGLAGVITLITGARLKLPAATLALMVIYLILDMTLGAVPIVGDAFDFFFRSHKRNVRLIEKHLEKTAGRQTPAD